MPTDQDHPLPSEAEVAGYFEQHCNWDRWGPDDSKGTINLVTDEKRRQAAALARSGRAVSLAQRINAPVGMPSTAQHYTIVTPRFAADYIGLFYHGYAFTHLDALCHVFWQGKMWNGKPAGDVTSFGGRSGTIDAWANGIATRGVLLDIPRLRGVSHVTADRPVRGWELEAAAESVGLTLEPGDALVVRSGEAAYLGAQSGEDEAAGHPGLHADVIPVLHRHDTALLVWDMQDARPAGYQIFDGKDGGGPVHSLAIAYLGMPLLDNADLEPLARACAEENRWEFLLTVNPLRVRGGTGSPVNPVAIL